MNNQINPVYFIILGKIQLASMLDPQTTKILDWKKMYWKAGKGYFAVHWTFTFMVHFGYIQNTYKSESVWL
jgi:hypothetical protein